MKPDPRDLPELQEAPARMANPDQLDHKDPKVNVAKPDLPALPAQLDLLDNVVSPELVVKPDLLDQVAALDHVVKLDHKDKLET